jgi:hypothetical protein
LRDNMRLTGAECPVLRVIGQMAPNRESP